MAVGQNANVGFNSYLVVGREATFKTYNTCTAGIDFLSASMKTTKERKIIEAISKKRTYADSVGLSKAIEGEVSFHMSVDNNASQYFLQNAMGGGAISSATATGDTTGGTAFEHTYSINGFDATYSSLCLNQRKGDATNGQIFEYNGVRVNEFNLTGEIDNELIANAALIACNSTLTTNDVSANCTVTGQSPLNFTNMRLSVESTFASLTASSFWHVQSFEFGIANNLKADTGSRRLGSDVLDVLPPGIAQFTFNFSMRFDTVTAFNAMLAETEFGAQLSFLGGTISGSSLRQELRIDMPRIFIMDAGDPEIGGPDEILVSDITCHVMRDDSSASGYAVQMLARNATSSYA